MDAPWDVRRHVRMGFSEDVLPFRPEEGARYFQEGGYQADAVERALANVPDRGRVEGGGPSAADRGTRASPDNDYPNTLRLKTQRPEGRPQVRRR
ncbi:hypothetical protein PPGU19_098970 (plasmid) [Paraburkholderia sp. PGU19]|nr:hypothetical protein PPGU19_098970 [Paraburkholderia sp. PGU19]